MKQSVLLAGVLLTTMAIGVLPAHAGREKMPIYLQFWVVKDDTPEPLDLIIPSTHGVCETGYTPLADTTWCGKIIRVHIASEINGDLYAPRDETVAYEFRDGAWSAVITAFPGLYVVQVYPFQDIVGLWHHVKGTLKINFFQDQTWIVERHEGQPFYMEARDRLPMIGNLECAIGLGEEERAEL